MGFDKPGNPVLYFVVAGVTGSAVHLALQAVDHAAVHAFHAAALASGGVDNGRPGPRPDYGSTYYASFVLDPDGHNIEAVFGGAGPARAGAIAPE